MKLIELKFFTEQVEEIDVNIIEVFLLGNPIMKYIVREDFFIDDVTKSIEGELPIGIKSILKMKNFKGEK